MWSLLCKKLSLPDPPECNYSNARRLRSLLTMEQVRVTNLTYLIYLTYYCN